MLNEMSYCRRSAGVGQSWRGPFQLLVGDIPAVIIIFNIFDSTLKVEYRIQSIHCMFYILVVKKLLLLLLLFYYSNKLGSYSCRKVEELVPRIDCLINNAGVFMTEFQAVFRIRIRMHWIHMFLGLPDPDLLVRGMAPDPDPSIVKQK
jgi:hypothetical protein